MEVGAKRGVEKGYLPEIPNSELLVMIPGSIGVVLAFVYWPVAMGNGYLNFFNHFFQQKEGIVQFRRVMLGQNVNAELMDLVRKTRQLPYRNAPPVPEVPRDLQNVRQRLTQCLARIDASIDELPSFYRVLFRKRMGASYGILFHDFLITYASI